MQTLFTDTNTTLQGYVNIGGVMRSGLRFSGLAMPRLKNIMPFTAEQRAYHMLH